MALALPLLSLGCDSACSTCGVKPIVEERVVKVRCNDCPKEKLVYVQEPAPPPKIIKVRYEEEPCPPPRIVTVKVPAPPQNVTYKYGHKPCGCD